MVVDEVGEVEGKWYQNAKQRLFVRSERRLNALSEAVCARHYSACIL